MSALPPQGDSIHVRYIRSIGQEAARIERVKTEMRFHVPAYNLERKIAMHGPQSPIEATRA